MFVFYENERSVIIIQYHSIQIILFILDWEPWDIFNWTGQDLTIDIFFNPVPFLRAGWEYAKNKSHSCLARIKKIPLKIGQSNLWDVSKEAFTQ